MQQHDSTLPQDPQLEMVATPDILAGQGWTELEEMSIAEFRAYSRQKPGQMRHYLITYHHRVATLTTLPPIGGPRE